MQAVRIAYELAEGVRAAHAVGVLHRDLEPANVMLDPEGRVQPLEWLTDLEALPWGCAALRESRLHLARADATPGTTLDRVTAIGVSGRGLLVAHDAIIDAIASDGTRSSLGSTSDATVTALLDDGAHVWWGSAHGRLHRIDDDASQGFASTSAVSHLGIGPEGTVVVGHADGHVTLLGRPLARGPPHGLSAWRSGRLDHGD